MKTCLPICLILILLCMGCSRVITNSVPENTPESNFEYLWQEYDRLYVAFELKGVDWDSVYAIYRPQVKSQTTDEELFLITSNMLALLRDGHVNLYTPLGNYSYTAWRDQYPRNYDREILAINYLDRTMNIADTPLQYRLLDEQIGYVYIDSFGGENWGGNIEIALREMGNIQGLIVDVRNNGGGSDRNARDIAGRFTNERRLYRHVQFRSSPKRTDFTPFRSHHFEPQGNITFTRSIVLLTNRHTFSAAESFVLMMRTLPQVTVVGDTTGGGSGNPVYRELPNGWTCRVPRWLAFTPDFEPYEGVGLAPDLWVSTPDALLESGTDRIFETAIEILVKK